MGHFHVYIKYGKKKANLINANLHLTRFWLNWNFCEKPHFHFHYYISTLIVSLIIIIIIYGHCSVCIVILECWLSISRVKLSNTGFGNAIKFGNIWIQSALWLSFKTRIYETEGQALGSICRKYGEFKWIFL